ncbi:polymorphic toxin type 27 domain-containing protein [Streptomyces sp. NPDC001571]
MRRRTLFGTPRSKRAALARGMSGTALATAAAVLAGLMGTMPAEADENGGIPADPFARPLRMSLGERARQDRCALGLAVHYGGPDLKVFANATLASSDADIGTALHGDSGYPSKGYYDASQKDLDAANAYGAEFQRRQKQLEDDHVPYAGANADGGRPYFAPLIGGDIAGFTLEGWKKIPGDVWTDPSPHPGAESIAQAKKVYDAIDTGDDYWATQYKYWAGSSAAGGLGITGGKAGSANDIATFLRFGGFATKAPEPDSLEFRTEVENLKMAWASCDSRNPVDHYSALSGPVVQAYGEWESEYASQTTQRKDIVTAEAAASQEARTAADLMIEAIRQSWLADQILFWQQWFRDHPNAWNKPSLTAQKDAARQLVLIRGRAPQLVKDADAAVARARTSADQAAAAQSSAWAVADQNNVPRGRALMYAQTSVQIAKADYAAARAAAATVLTASKAIQANMADSQALYALAQTQSHAMNTEFRKAAALEARAQAKAAADSADKLTKETAANATTAKNAQARAEVAEKTAKAGADEAKKQRGIAETEKANAERERDTSARERAKAQEAEARAQTERDAAGRAMTAAQAQGSTAASKKDDALVQELRAQRARDAAAEAERKRDTLAARAEATEALFAAVDGTAAAIEAREAATKARSAANDSTTAATAARQAADDATAAASSAREAATRSAAAASRATAAAQAAWSAFMTTSAAASTAHSAAAAAIDAAAAAKGNADKADAEAKKAQSAATTARTEAEAARDEAGKSAAWSAKTAGYAYAAGQAAQGARDAALTVVKAADQAVALGSPYREADASAAFAVLIGQVSKPLTEQQAAAAEAKGREAAKAAADAQALADKAAGDAKIAAQAAADAATDARKALTSAAAARVSAAEAATAAKASKQADSSAQQHLAQAGTDTMYAGFAAADANTAATQADRDATDAEKDAASARNAATAAEKDAGTARGVADQAERDATTAETAAAHARELAVEAVQISIRTQNAEIQAWEERQRSPDGGTGVDGVVMRPSEDSKFDIDPKSDCVGTHSGSEIGCEIDLEFHIYGSMDYYLETCPLPGVSRAKCGSALKRDYLMSGPLDVRFLEKQVHIDGLKLTVSILKAVAQAAVKDINDCRHGVLSGCLWLAGSIVIPSALLKAVEVAFAVRLAVVDGTRLTTALWNLRGAGLSAEAVANLERAGIDALIGRCFPAGTKVATADGPKPIEQIKVGDRVWSTNPATGTRSLQRVLKLFNRPVDQLVRIRTAGGEVSATDSHRFWVQNKGWVEARALRAGDNFQTQDGKNDRVLGTTLAKGKTQVFNFEVENAHTYYVYAGSTPVLVHNECFETLIKDLVADGDHILLGINPGVDELAASVGGRTFNGKAFAKPVEIAGGKPAWMVGVEAAMENQTVRLGVSLDGVEGAKTAEEALAMLVKRGQEAVGPNWKLATQTGYGTAWEMATLRVKVLLEKRSFQSIQWYWKNVPYKFDNVPADWIP